LRVVHSSKDTAALLRIINVPNRRLGKGRIAVLVKDSETKGRSLWDSIQALIDGNLRFTSKDEGAEAGLASLVRCINMAQQQVETGEIRAVSVLIDCLQKRVHYDEYLMKKFGPDANERIANLEELKMFSMEVDRVTEENALPDIGVMGARQDEETTLSRFLGNVALMTDVRDGGEDKVDCVWLLGCD
jgi:superfamily I DNA/RNA helicase